MATGGYFAFSKNGLESTTYRDGQPVQRYTETSQSAPRQRSARAGDPNLLPNPKLKLERAKRHIQDLESWLLARKDRNLYTLTHEIDPKTGENVYRVQCAEDVPIDFSPVIGDAVHNLRCVLDHLVCDLIRANGSEVNGNSGLPIDKRANRYKPGRVPKICGVSAKAERLLLRLKSGERINSLLYVLHMLDIIDKHNAIVTIGAATVQIKAKVGVPGMFVGPDGDLRLLGPGTDGIPLMMDAGTPDKFRRVFPLENNTEIYRSPAGFNEEILASIDVAFGQEKGFATGAEGEPVLATLQQLTNIVERILWIFEKYAL